MGFFSFCKLKRLASFQHECCNYLLKLMTIMNEATTQFFQQRNMLKCQIILKKRRDSSVENKPIGFFLRYRWASFRDYFFKLKRETSLPAEFLFEVLRYPQF